MAGTLPVYSPVASSVSPAFINHHCCQVPGHRHHPRKHPYPSAVTSEPPGSQDYAFCACGHFIQTESNSTCPFVSGFSHLV